MNRPWLDHYPAHTPTTIEIPELTLYELFAQSCETYSEKTAILFNDKSITYHELKTKVDRLAAAWHQIGAKKGEKVGLMIGNHPDYCISYYAAQKLGVTVVQVNPMYTARELSEIFQDAQIEYLVTEKSQLDKVKAASQQHQIKKIFVTGDGEESLHELTNTALPGDTKAAISPKDDVAVIQYTGGTTGKMKGAMLTHYNIVANVFQSKALYGDMMDVGKETFLVAIPLYHVYAMTAGMHLCIHTGSRLLLIEKFVLEHVIEQIKRYQPTFFPGVPKMYNAFVNHPGIADYGLNCFKICTSGSAPIPIEVIKQFEALTGATIGEGFGLSETSPTTHRNPPMGVRKVGSIGIPLPDTDSKIVAEDGRDCLPHEVGELLIKGPQVMKGYLNKVEETQQAIKQDWFYTGDLATMDEDGYFYIVGRKKEMIIVGGFNIYPQEVEGILYEYPDVLEAAVAGIPNEAGDETIKAYVVPKTGRNIDIEELRGHCYRHLTRYKVPKFFEIRDQLPRNTVGKLLKRVLIEEEKNKPSYK